jgi:hypothetical protein
MSTSLSFAPRYHELTQPEAFAIWVPMYNPKRECVAQERQRIEAEGFQVETRAEKLEHLLAPARNSAGETLRRARAELVHEVKLAAVTVLVVLGVFFFLSYVFGTLAVRWFYPTWFATLSWLPATAMVYGVGALVAGPTLFVLARKVFRVETR